MRTNFKLIRQVWFFDVTSEGKEKGKEERNPLEKGWGFFPPSLFLSLHLWLLKSDPSNQFEICPHFYPFSIMINIFLIEKSFWKKLTRKCRWICLSQKKNTWGKKSYDMNIINIPSMLESLNYEAPSGILGHFRGNLTPSLFIAQTFKKKSK